MSNKNIPTNTGKHLNRKKIHSGHQRKDKKSAAQRVHNFIMNEIQGMENFLQAVIDSLNLTNEEYVKQLQQDLRIALNNYKDRYQR